MSDLCQANGKRVTNPADDTRSSECCQECLWVGEVFFVFFFNRGNAEYFRVLRRERRIPAEEPHPTEVQRRFPLMPDK